MAREIAVFRVRQGHGDDFITAYGSVSDVLTGAEGNRGASLHRGIEEPDAFTLIVEWDSVESHTALTQKPESERFGEAVSPTSPGSRG